MLAEVGVALPISGVGKPNGFGKSNDSHQHSVSHLGMKPGFLLTRYS